MLNIGLKLELNLLKQLVFNIFFWMYGMKMISKPLALQEMKYV